MKENNYNVQEGDRADSICSKTESSQFKRVDKQRRAKRNTRVIFETLDLSVSDASSFELLLHACKAIYMIKKIVTTILGRSP